MSILNGLSCLGNIQITDGKALEFFESKGSGNNKVTIQAPSSITANSTVTLPAGGTPGDFVQTDGSGVWNFQNPDQLSTLHAETAVASTGNQMFFLHSNGKATDTVVTTQSEQGEVVGTSTISGVSSFENFVSVIAVTGERVMVGEWWDSSDAGRVRVFNNAIPYSLDQTITDSLSTAGHKFGWSVSASGDRLAVSKYSETVNDKIFIYDHGGASYAETQVIDRKGSNNFGKNIALDGDYLVAGDFGASSVYVYKKTASFAWVFTITGAATLGYSVDISGTTIITGIPTVSGIGSSEIHEKNVGETWTLTHTMSPTGSFGDSRFGIDVSIDGNVASMARTNSSGFQNTLVFSEKDGTWSDNFLTFSLGNEFYTSVSVTGTSIYTGHPFYNSSRGIVTKFEKNGTWAETGTFQRTAPTAGSFFGSSLSVTTDDRTLGVFAQGASSNLGTATMFSSSGPFSFIGYNTDTAVVNNPVDIQYSGIYEFDSPQVINRGDILVENADGTASLILRSAFVDGMILKGLVLSTTQILLY